jgi:hypothetical protein
MVKRNAPNLSVAGLKVIITAGAAGIGRAIAEAFADGGSHVEVCDIAEDALADLKRARPDIPGHIADVADPKAIARFFARATKGGLDVLVNNAGIAGPTAPIDEISPKDWEATIDINLNSMFHCTRLAVPLLKKAGGGSIVSRRQAWVPAPHALCGDQMGSGRPDQEPCNGARPPQDPRQRHPARHRQRPAHRSGHFGPRQGDGTQLRAAA